VSANSTPAAGSAPVVVVATGISFPDALAAAPMAADAGGPLLLVPGVCWPKDVLAELHRVAADGARLVIVGGTNAVAQSVEHVDAAVCPDPAPPAVLAGRFDRAARYASSRQGVVAMSVSDVGTGETRERLPTVQMRAASAIKVGIAWDVLMHDDRARRSPSAAERRDLAAMIRESDNDAASRLWAGAGGPGVIADLHRVLGTSGTSPPDNGTSWGFTLTTARDLARVLTSLATGSTLSRPSNELLLTDMLNVDPSQRWGVAEGAPPGSSVALKNGWYPDDGEASWRVHCTGIVFRPHLSTLVIVIMTKYPIALGLGYGQTTCRDAARLLLG
jgi:hypothetical protein